MASQRAMDNYSNPAVVMVSNPAVMAVVAVSSHPLIMLPLTAVPRQPVVATVNPLVAMASPLVGMASRRDKCREVPPTDNPREAAMVAGRCPPALVAMASPRAVMGSNPKASKAPRVAAMVNKHHRTPAVMASLILVVGSNPKLLARTSMVSNHPRVVSTRRQASMRRNRRVVRSHLLPCRASR